MVSTTTFVRDAIAPLAPRLLAVLDGIRCRLLSCLAGWVAVKVETLELCQGPTGAGVGQSRYTGVTDLVVVEVKRLRTWHIK